MAIDRQQLIQRVQEIEGLSDDERAGLLQLLREQKKYGIVWEDKPEEAEQRLATELPVLTEVKERYIAGATPDAPNHILIEGDNLHALTALSYTHEGKIDVIYIDPPYNTGNKDFVYNDSYVDREDGYRHSKWLSFMNKRLQIAKRLLSDRGVIFISIDDNEQAQLKLLCDEVFGEYNQVACLIWQKKKGGGNDSKYVATEHEYIHVYCKCKNDLENLFITYQGEYLRRYKEKDDKGRFFWDTFKRKSGKQYYAIHCPDGCVLEKEDNGEPISWLRSEDRFLSDLAEGEARIIKINGKWTVRFKQRMPEGYKPRSILNDCGTTSDGSNDLKGIFNVSNLFDNPKPLSLIGHLLKIKNGRTILDFFAGSGTTLHATMQLNAEDGGRRQCILVTNNENGICENVTYERNRRVIQGYTTPKGVDVAGLADNTLRYYRTDFVPNDTTIRNKRRLMSLSTDMLCIKNNLYCEQDEFAGRKLNKQKMRYFTEQTQSSGNKSMLVVYDEQVVDTLVDVLAEMDVKQKIMIYVFSNTSYPHTDNFEEVLTKVELCALPSAILNAYRKITGR